MKRISYSLFLLFVACFALTSCKQVFLGLYGMKMPKEMSEKSILRAGKKYHIPPEDSYQLDSTYRRYLFSLDTSKFKQQIKNHYQPLQALYYNKNGTLESFQINCYAGGFPNLKWNRNEIFEVFPPKQQAPADSLLSLKTQIQFLLPLSKTAQIDPGKTDYFVIVHWNRFMGRQTRRLLRHVQKNAKLTTDGQLKIVYVNNDNHFLKDF
ncbi:hypothetical protein [uncultured Fluviicola sp.]|uniref:hypothetical protein n=1 Tax=uncultured Fluviicola sp. TaxID=463303 RepID=UPI0025D23C07|nr:hypothetical protein [uncultured Fluviicola sp.]